MAKIRAHDDFKTTINYDNEFKYTRFEWKKLRTPNYQLYILYQKEGAKFLIKCNVIVSPSEKDTYKKMCKLRKDYILNYTDRATLDNIKSIRTRIDSIVSDYINDTGEKPSTDYVQKKYFEEQTLNKKKESGVLSFYPEFLKHKDLIVKENTIKLYTNNEKIINSFFELHPKFASTPIASIDEHFFSKFINYLINEHAHVGKTNLKTKGFGNAVTKGIVTKFIEYLSFTKYKFKTKIDIDSIKYNVEHMFKKDKIQIKHKEEIALNELELSYYLKYIEENEFNQLQKKGLEIFLFMCLTGLSTIDVLSLSKKNINGDYLQGERTKTSQGFKVPLHSIAREIFVRYNFDLKFNEDHINRNVIKKAFFNVFEAVKQDYPDYDTTWIQTTHKGRKIESVTDHKSKFVTMRTSRNTFITITANKDVPLLLIQSMVGHKKGSQVTLNNYVKGVEQGTETDIIKIQKI